MSKQQLLAEIQKLPVEEQRQILEALSSNLAQSLDATPKQMSEAQFEQMLLEKGLIDQIPQGLEEEEEDFEPIVVHGKPLAQTIIEERR